MTITDDQYAAERVALDGLEARLDALRALGPSQSGLDELAAIDASLADARLRLQAIR